MTHAHGEPESGTPSLVEQAPADLVLCESCKADDAAWRNAPMTITGSGIRIHTIDGSLRGALDHRQHRAEKYYETVRWQRDLIRRICATKHQELAA